MMHWGLFAQIMLLIIFAGLIAASAGGSIVKDLRKERSP